MTSENKILGCNIESTYNIQDTLKLGQTKSFLQLKKISGY